ncbi:MAG: LPS export ABC transporter permease LptF [Burkholderiaceae bacterium]
MLFDSALRKELARSFGATLVVLITVVLSMMLIRTLGLASGGKVDPQDVMMLMGYAALGHLPTILTLSLFISITSTVGRMYRDSEMAIWFTAGRGLASFIAPLFRFAWPILLAIGVLALFVWPWSNQQSQLLRERYETRGDLDRVSAGQFQENASGSRVFFIEREDMTGRVGDQPGAEESPVDASKGKTGRNVFISSTENNKQAVTSARSGRLDRIGEDQFLILNNGQRLEQQVGQAAVKLSEFTEYGTKVGHNRISTADTAPAKTLPTLRLLNEPSKPHMAELSWRLGLVLAAFNLALLALVVSASNPRAGRGYGLMFALLAFVIYYNLLNIGFGWVGSGRLGFTNFMLALHGGAFIATCLWLTARNNSWSLRNLMPQRTQAAPLARSPAP